jgi:hypothetical protein
MTNFDNGYLSIVTNESAVETAARNAKPAYAG